MNRSRKKNATQNATDAAQDHSLLAKPLKLGIENVAQIASSLVNGTQEVKDLLLNECDIIYECRVCGNLFRNIANYLAHKQMYCKDRQHKEHVPEMVVAHGNSSDQSIPNPESNSIGPTPNIQTNSQEHPMVGLMFGAIGNSVPEVNDPTVSTEVDAVNTQDPVGVSEYFDLALVTFKKDAKRQLEEILPVPKRGKENLKKFKGLVDSTIIEIMEEIDISAIRYRTKGKQI